MSLHSTRWCLLASRRSEPYWRHHSPWSKTPPWSKISRRHKDEKTKFCCNPSALDYFVWSALENKFKLLQTHFENPNLCHYFRKLALDYIGRDSVLIVPLFMSWRLRVSNMWKNDTMNMLLGKSLHNCHVFLKIICQRKICGSKHQEGTFENLLLLPTCCLESLS